MFDLRTCFNGVLLVALIAGLASPANAQASRPGAGSSSRMKVMERQTPPEATPTYAIVGAVVQSGVYATKEQPFTIGRLIDAAGGLLPDAQTTLRVIRHGDVRFQIPLPAEPSSASDPLMAGDIVVVAPRQSARETAAGAERIVPVVCVGLSDRPVVLPLDSSITTVQELTRRLGQSPHVGQTARLITPSRNAGSAQLMAGSLMSGSVVFFDPELIDRVPLQNPGFLPGLIDLDEMRTSAYPGVLPSDTPEPPDVPAAEIIQQASGDMVTPPHLEFVTGMAPANSTEHFAAQQQQRPLSVPPLQSNRELPQAVSAATPERTAPSSLIPPDLSQALELFTMESAGSETAETKTLEAPAPALQVHAPPQMASVTQTAGMQNDSLRDSLREGPPAASPPATHNLDGDSSARSVGTATERPSDAGPAIAASVTQIAGDTAGQTTAPNRVFNDVDSSSKSSRMTFGFFGALFVTGAAISVLGGIVLILSLVLFGSSGDSCPSPVPGLLDPPEPQATPPEQLSSAATQQRTNIPRTHLQELLNRSVPIVEEGVAIPEAWPLHGKVVGHRKFIVNAAHAGPTGPHFGNTGKIADRTPGSRRSQKVSEERLRKSLRELIEPSSETEPEESAAKSLLGDQPNSVNRTESDRQSSRARSEEVLPLEPPSNSSAPQRAPVEPPVRKTQKINGTPLADIPEELDIVQPPSPPQQTSPKSPLERALRALASEKRG